MDQRRYITGPYGARDPIATRSDSPCGVNRLGIRRTAKSASEVRLYFQGPTLDELVWRARMSALSSGRHSWLGVANLRLVISFPRVMGYTPGGFSFL